MNVYLKSYLAPFELWLAREDVTDILVNRPGEVWVETAGGGTLCEAAPDVTEIVLQRLARQIAGTTHQGVNREQPLLSASLPGGARVQIVAPPATRQGLALAIRKHTISNLSIDELDGAGLFRRPSDADIGASDEALAKLLAAGDQANFLKEAVKARKTIVISGGTSSGKTTLLNALVKLVDRQERLIVIEDTPEIKLEHANALGLIAVRGELGEARVGAEDLLEASLRMRPDRILLGELRGKEAFTFLRAVNTGHPGSVTTVHADSADAAVEQITMMALLAGLGVDWRTIETYVRQVVDVIVQMRRTAQGRFVSDIIFKPSSPRPQPSA
ncbi:MAG TPA: P-type DNA transfer ATPase VirB11 [Rhizomicrobium sp.]|nr:P-type DNA transfer ATPase VirB11 [Rhizomicrobium sp.]